MNTILSKKKEEQLERVLKKHGSLWAKINQEIEDYYNFLNTAIGVVSFSFALGSAQSDYPRLFGLLSLSFILIWLLTSKPFPSRVKRLMDKSKQEKRSIKTFLKNKVNGTVKIVTHGPLFIFGVIFLVIVAFL